MEIPKFINRYSSPTHASLKQRSFGLMVSVEAISSPGSRLKKNEDTFTYGIDSKYRIYAAVFDGVSSQVDIPGLNEWGISGGLFAASFLRHNFGELSDLNLKSAFIDMNKRLREESQLIEGVEEYEMAFWPASTGTAVRIDMMEQTVELAHVGDSFFAVEFANEERRVITDDRNKKFDEELIQKLVNLAKSAGTSPRAANDFEEMIEAKKASFRIKMNNSQGFGNGVFNGDPYMEGYIQHQSLDLNDVMFALLGTDGLVVPNLDIRTSEGLDHVMRLARSQGVGDLIKYRDYVTSIDPKWVNFPRLKQCDDGTGISFRFHRF